MSADERRVTSCNTHHSVTWRQRKIDLYDLRFDAPVSVRAKKPLKMHDTVPDNWVPRTDPQIYCIQSLPAIPNANFISQPWSRCEEWSVLRAMLPSTRTIKKTRECKWGNGKFLPPLLNKPSEMRSNLNLISSPPTR